MIMIMMTAAATDQVRPGPGSGRAAAAQGIMISLSASARQSRCGESLSLRLANSVCVMGLPADRSVGRKPPTVAGYNGPV